MLCLSVLRFPTIFANVVVLTKSDLISAIFLFLAVDKEIKKKTDLKYVYIDYVQIQTF